MNQVKPPTFIRDKIGRGEDRATVRDVRLTVNSKQSANNTPAVELVLNLQPVVGKTDDVGQPNVTVTLAIGEDDARALASNITVLFSRAKRQV